MAETTIERKEATAPEVPERGVTHTPRVDILESDDELLLFVDLPGVHSKDLDVRFENGELTLTGRRVPHYPGKPWLWEYEPGSFYRGFRVTEQIAAEKINAELKNGVLTVRLPKLEAAKPRRIAVMGE